MTLLHDVLGQISSFLKNNNDDKTDKFHYRYTVQALSIYLIVLTSRQLYGNPLQCVVNDATSGASRDYIHTLCYINGTHRYDSSKFAKDQVFDSSTQLKYYPWITLFLVLQAFMFYFPSFLWKCINNWNGFDLIRISNDIAQKNYVELSSDERRAGEARELIQTLTGRIKLSFVNTKIQKDDSKEGLLRRALSKKAKYEITSKTKHQAISRLKPSFPLFWSYIIIKLVYLANAFAQFFLIVTVYNIDGVVEFSQMLVNHAFLGLYEFDNVYFPKTSYCIFKLLRSQGPNDQGVLCALPLNLFNEIFYSGLWLWLLLVVLITLLSIIYWLSFTLGCIRRAQVKKSINFAVADSNESIIESTGLSLNENFNNFYKDICTLDLFLAIKLIAINTNTFVAEDILNSLWCEYLNIQYELKRPLPTLPKTHKFDYNRIIVHSTVKPEQHSSYQQEHGSTA